MRILSLALIGLLVACPSISSCEDILSGVARTVEDIGGQIVGNPAAKRNDKLQRDMARDLDRQNGDDSAHIHVVEPARDHDTAHFPEHPAAAADDYAPRTAEDYLPKR